MQGEKIKLKLSYICSVCCVFLIFQSCDPAARDASMEVTTYFPLRTFVDGLGEELSGQTVIKEVTVNGISEQSEQKFQKEDWLNEFEFFIQNDINKPALSSAYTISKVENITKYTLKEGEKNKTKELAVVYEKDQVRELSFLEKKKNFFYTSETKGVMVIDPETGNLSGYSIESYQDVLWSKPNRMTVEGKVKL